MSFWRNYYHLVWVTKNREPLIQPEYEAQIYGYIVNKGAELGVFSYAIGGCADNMDMISTAANGVFSYAIGGCADHIHIIAAVPPKHAVAYVVKNLKGASSFYVNHVIRPANFTFAWQKGYGCLTLRETQLPDAEAYVQRQKQHQGRQTTNRWLERYEELDEGPTSTEWTTDAIHLVQETAATYDVEPGDFPF